MSIDLSRRGFLSAFIAGAVTAAAAPAILRSGVIMPVRSLILPEAPALLLANVVTRTEMSYDGINWITIGRMVSQKGSKPSLPLMKPNMGKDVQLRTIIEREWRPIQHSISEEAAARKAARYAKAVA